MPRAPAAALVIREEDRRELLQVIGLRSVPQSVALRVRIVLGASEGIGNKVLARQLGTSLPTVLLWRGRFQSEGLSGILEDRARSGRPREITPAQEATLVEKTLHPDVKQWFADHPRYQVHFTPTSASWLNQVERWFAEITRKRIRRGTFRSVRELEKAIRAYIRDHNKAPQPFHWVATANTIIKKVRKYKRTSETLH
jgi:transposase